MSPLESKVLKLRTTVMQELEESSTPERWCDLDAVHDAFEVILKNVRRVKDTQSRVIPLFPRKP